MNLLLDTHVLLWWLDDPNHDPFDRMLIAQTMAEGLTIVTRDSDILRYPVGHICA